jgi:hypothetical protein
VCRKRPDENPALSVLSELGDCKSLTMNQELKVSGLDFDTPEFLEWNPEDPLDCDVWATASIGGEGGSVL